MLEVVDLVPDCWKSSLGRVERRSAVPAQKHPNLRSFFGTCLRSHHFTHSLALDQLFTLIEFFRRPLEGLKARANCQAPKQIIVSLGFKYRTGLILSRPIIQHCVLKLWTVSGYAIRLFAALQSFPLFSTVLVQKVRKSSK